MYRGGELAVEVLDEGAAAAPSRSSGRGLAGMGERVALYDGVLEFGARAEGGFGVIARFPVAPS
jgi:signal transduction histidine kinase